MIFCVQGVACNEAVLIEQNTLETKTAEQSKDTNRPSGDLSDIPPTASPPVSVAGAFLYLKCAQEVFPTSEIIEAVIGCRLVDQNENRQPAASIYSSFEFSWKPQSDQDLRIAVKNLDDNARYDSLYLLKSSTAAALEAGMKSLQIIFRKDSSQDPQEQIVGLLPEISVAADSINEQASFDYSAMSNEYWRLGNGREPTPPPPN